MLCGASGARRRSLGLRSWLWVEGTWLPVELSSFGCCEEGLPLGLGEGEVFGGGFAVADEDEVFGAGNLDAAAGAAVAGLAPFGHRGIALAKMLSGYSMLHLIRVVWLGFVS